MKKLYWLLLCAGWIAPLPVHSQVRLIDSLRTAYDAATDVRKRVDILLDLRDLNDSSDKEMYYSRELLDRAREAGDSFAAGSALGTLAAYYIGDPALEDSLEMVLRSVEPLLRGSSMDGLAEYYRMVKTARRLQEAGTEQSVQLSKQYIDSIRAYPPRNVYEEASQLFLKGIAVYKLGSADGRMRMHRGLPYWQDELALLPRMKPTARRNFHANLLTCLIATYSDEKDRNALMKTADDYLAMLDDYYRDAEIVRRRPYIPKEMSYLVCYYTMCTSPLIDRQKAEVYYNRYRRFVQTAKSENNILIDKRRFYNISIAYYDRWGDYRQQMAYNDSLILITRTGGMPALLAGMYDLKAKLYERMGRYKEACEVYDYQLKLRDSLSRYQYAQKIGELEVQYGLDKAERDKALILAQKRQNTLWFAGAILLLALLAVVYLWRNLMHIKRLQHNLRIESQRAQESDRLKRDFMGSMSHEIRTPLNAINGFAELISEGGLSQEESAEFAQIIRDNTRIFTSLINDMLEVSQLDNTMAVLPRTPLDVCRIIRTETEHLPQKPGVECRLEFAVQEVVVPLHRGYMSLLVRELVTNAMKFTGQGTVTISCAGVRDGKLVFAVTDTGCGIAPEFAEKVFERFYKIDPFGQGLGLGLSLCRLIAEKLGGEIHLDSSYTGGARFVVTLPVGA